MLNAADAMECADLDFDSHTTSFLMLLRALSMKKGFLANVEKFIVYSEARFHFNAIRFLKTKLTRNHTL